VRARSLVQEKGWVVKADGDKGFRRVVASPAPLQVLEARAIKARRGGSQPERVWHRSHTYTGIHLVLIQRDGIHWIVRWTLSSGHSRLSPCPPS